MSDKFSLNVYLDVRNALPSRRPIVSRLFDLKSSRAEDGPFLSSRVQSAEPGGTLRTRAHAHGSSNHRIPSQSGSHRRALFATVKTMLLWALYKISVVIAYTQGSRTVAEVVHITTANTQQDRKSGAAVSVEKRRVSQTAGSGSGLWDLGMDEEPGSDVRSDQNSAHPMIHIWHCQ